ncbi:MAG: hypothetical protein F4239_07515 [Gammaproteobacteria bacterium]|nr:hypothetical protein [Gammaproteobacteria bacterium]MYD78720.1 hypothetical protein [Gammaproteobacteria bacterium]
MTNAKGQTRILGIGAIVPTDITVAPCLAECFNLGSNAMFARYLSFNEGNITAVMSDTCS